MSDETPGKLRVVEATAVFSLVAAFACTLADASDAATARPDPRVREADLPARVARVVEHIRSIDPKLLRNLPLEKIAQWRN